MVKANQSKGLRRSIYREVCGIPVIINRFFQTKTDPAVYYGGARAGDRGGPLVKVRRLQKHFPEVRWGFNLVYSLSNTPYLNQRALSGIQRQKIPLVHNQNGTFYPAWFDGDWRQENRRMSLAFHAADYVFYQSQFCFDAANEHLGQRAGPGEVLYNAVDTDNFTPAEPGQKRDRFRFLLTGKIDQHLWYRVERSIRGLRVALDLGGEVILIIAGWLDANVREKADDLIKSLSLTGRVKFNGPYTQSLAPAVYRMADAYIMMKHQDPCPNTVIEALSTGLPVLYSHTGGVAELVGTRAGIGLDCKESWDEVHAPSTEDIGIGMIRIIDEHKSMKREARRRAIVQFGIRRWIQRHREVFAQLLNSKV